jgi:uncharacterized protein (DUF2147 family)
MYRHCAKWRISLVLWGLLLLSLPARADGPEGVWLNEAGTLRMRVSPCGAAFCGTLVWARDQRADDYNPDPVKRGQPLLGMRILSGMTPSGNANEWKGNTYSYEDGRSYIEVMTLTGEILLTQGCVNGGAICHSGRWTKVN